MTLEGEFNRPNTADEEEDLEAIAEADNQPLAQVLEPPEEPADRIEAVAEEPLSPNVLPDFSLSIEEINRSLNSIQEEINQLALQPIETRAEAQQGEDIDAGEVDEFENAYKDLDKNLNNIDEVLTKLDQDNDLLQEKLRHLLNTIRIDNTNDQQETQ